MSFFSSSTPVFCNAEARVRRTALQELALALGLASADALHTVSTPPRGPAIVMGALTDCPPGVPLIREGLTNLHNVSPDCDAFELCRHDGVLYLLGTTGRGLLQSVFQFQECLAAQEPMDDGFRRAGAFQIPQRIFHLRFNAWPCVPGDVRYLAHLGASHALLSHDWQGNRRLMQGYVTSPVFPEAVDRAEVAASAAALRRTLDECADYGLGAMIWLTELPCQGGPWVPEPARQQFLQRFPAEVLGDSGTYEGKVLCFSHPRIQEFYRDLVQRFFGEFPEIETVFLFGGDSSGEFCDPTLCPRCRGLSRFEQRDRLIRFLIDEGQRVRPGLRVLTTGWEWDRRTDEFLARQRALPAASGLYLAAQKDGWQAERQSHAFLREARKICREQGQGFIGYDNLHWGDDTVHSLRDIQDFPLGIGAKIRRWHELDVDGVFDHWGSLNENLSSNSIACREFFLNPLADADEVSRRIAWRQFGAAAGPLVLQAWQELEQAHAILSNACTWTPGQWPGWCECRRVLPIPEAFDASRLPATQLPPRQAGAFTYNPCGFGDSLQAVGDTWRLAYPRYARAAALLDEAHRVADASPLFYSFWWNGSPASPSRREHIRRQALFVKAVGLTGRDIGLHFGLHALYEAADHDAGRYFRDAAALLREDAEACLAASAFFSEVVRSGDDLNPQRGWAEQYLQKAEGIRKLLG